MNKTKLKDKFITLTQIAEKVREQEGAEGEKGVLIPGWAISYYAEALETIFTAIRPMQERIAELEKKLKPKEPECYCRDWSQDICGICKKKQETFKN